MPITSTNVTLPSSASEPMGLPNTSWSPSTSSMSSRIWKPRPMASAYTSACARMVAGISEAMQPNSAAAEIITPVLSRFSTVNPAASRTSYTVSSTCPATIPSAPQARDKVWTASRRFSAGRQGASVIRRNASGCSASPASTASVSPYTLWLVGLPRRRSSSSMQGRSSWIRE